jgi:septum site-determining protein MinD
MLAIAGGKGGSGKTTTTACLARALATAGHDPIAVDGDCDMPNLHVVAGAPAAPGTDAFAAGEELPEVTHPTVELPGVEVLPSGRGDKKELEVTLSALSTVPRRVLVDTPAGVSPTVATALRAADGVVIVTTPTRESLEDAVKTAAMARSLDADVVGAVVTMSDGSVDPADLLNCRTLTHVPDVDSPLTDETVTERYEAVSKTVHKRNI